MPCTEPIQWMHEAKTNLAGSRLLKVEYCKVQMVLMFTKLNSLTFWNAARSTLIIKSKAEYSIKAQDKETDKQYWALKVEEYLEPLYVISVYVSTNDNIILSFGHPMEKVKLFDYQLVINTPLGARLKI